MPRLHLVPILSTHFLFKISTVPWVPFSFLAGRDGVAIRVRCVFIYVMRPNSEGNSPSPKTDDARWDIIERVFTIAHVFALIAAAAENTQGPVPTPSIAWVSEYIKGLCEDTAEMVEMS
ncbi:MAG: hypothetical protein BWY70_01661 [Bacteroidetes bacterium ADurb.Bin408]|nr:MAG: hypothetical protein BWY70_01661 [Bacteroidetes bacterium ADurb.Bin408]